MVYGLYGDEINIKLVRPRCDGWGQSRPVTTEGTENLHRNEKPWYFMFFKKLVDSLPLMNVNRSPIEVFRMRDLGILADLIVHSLGNTPWTDLSKIDSDGRTIYFTSGSRSLRDRIPFVGGCRPQTPAARATRSHLLRFLPRTASGTFGPLASARV